MKITDTSVLTMPVSVPVAISSQIGPCPVISGLEPKTPPKTLPRRKPGYRENHIYDTVPMEGTFYKKSYSPVSFPRKPVPHPSGKTEPIPIKVTPAAESSSLNVIATPNPTLLVSENIKGKPCTASVDKPMPPLPEEPVLEDHDGGETVLTSQEAPAVRSEKAVSSIADKSHRQGWPDLEDKIALDVQSSLLLPKEKDTSTQVKREDKGINGATDEDAEQTSQLKKDIIEQESSSQEADKSDVQDVGVRRSVSMLDSSMSKEPETETTKSSAAGLFLSDHRSTTCSASSACSAASATSSASASSAASTSSNTSSESSESSIGKSFFNTSHLGSSTPKRTKSPKNCTPVENLYDSWSLNLDNKGNIPLLDRRKGLKNSVVSKKSSGYYAEISEFISTDNLGNSSIRLTESQNMVVLPPPLQFCGSIRKTREPVVYVNLPTQNGLCQKSKRNHTMEREYVDPKGEITETPAASLDKAKYKGSTTSLNKTCNEYETPISIGTKATQTELKQCTGSCECEGLVCQPAQVEGMVSEIKQERNMRLVSEQLVKMVEVEVKELKDDLLNKKKELSMARDEKLSAQGELREATKIAAQYKVQVSELEKSLARARKEIANLERGQTGGIVETSSSVNPKEQDDNLDRKIAEAKDTEAKARLEVVQTELLASKDEVNQLLSRLAQASREKAEMVSGTIHRELVRMAEDRANHAEARALALEHELRRLLESRERNANTFPRSSPKPPQIPPRMNDIKQPMTSVGIRTSPKHFQKHNSTAVATSSTYSSGNLGGKNEAPVVRCTAGRTGNKRAKAHNRSWSPSRLRKVEASKANKEVKNEEEKEVKNTVKVSFLQRVQSRVSSAQTKLEVQKSLFNRMQSRFFAKSPKSVAAPPSNCELPDVSSLEEGSTKSEYEIPMEPVQRFARTPLILGDESAEESDWSSEEEGSAKRPRTDSGHRKARRSQRAGKTRKPKNNAGTKEAKSEEKAKGRPSEDASSQPRAPVTSLADILSSKEGLKSAGQKSNAKESPSGSDDVDGKGTKEAKIISVSKKSDNADATSPTVIKIKPPPPKAPKPKAKRTSSSKSIDTFADGKKRNDKTFSFGSLENIFDGMEVTQPKLTSYKRTMGPQGRRLPQRYSNQPQRYSNQSRNSMTAVSA